MKETDPIQRLRIFVAGYKTQRTAAKALGISEPYLCDLLKGRRTFSAPMLKRLGLRKAIVA